MTKIFQKLTWMIRRNEARATTQNDAIDNREDEAWVRDVTAMTDTPKADFSFIDEARHAKARRAAAHRRVDDKLRTCFDHILDEPVPERILKVLQDEGNARGPATSPVNNRPSVPEASGSPAVPLGQAIAAGIILCVVSGFVGLVISETFLDSADTPSLTTTLPADDPLPGSPDMADTDDLEGPYSVEPLPGTGGTGEDEALDIQDNASLIEPGGIPEAAGPAGPVTAPLEDDAAFEESPVSFQ